MLRLRSDLPLRGDTASRFVFWIVAILVFVAALAVTASSYVDALLEGWNRSVTGTLTIQIPTGGAEDNSSASVSNMLDALRKHSDVVSAVVLPNEKISELLEPWLGESSIIADLPLPLLVDVHLSDSTAEAAKNIVELTQRTAPTAIVEDHRVWLNRIIGLAEGLSVIALSVMGLVTGALSLIVIFATRASLTEYAQAIDVLRIVGAKDGYVAGQFARRAFAQGFFGGIAGLALYGPTLGAITWLAGRVEKGLLPDITMPIRHWLILLALPAAAGGLAMFAANITVRRILARRV